MVLMRLLGGQQWRCRHRGQTYGHGAGGGGVGETMERAAWKHITLPYGKQIPCGNLPHDSGNSKQGSVTN